MELRCPTNVVTRAEEASVWSKMSPGRWLSYPKLALGERNDPGRANEEVLVAFQPPGPRAVLDCCLLHVRSVRISARHSGAWSLHAFLPHLHCHQYRPYGGRIRFGDGSQPEAVVTRRLAPPAEYGVPGSSFLRFGYVPTFHGRSRSSSK